MASGPTSNSGREFTSGQIREFLKREPDLDDGGWLPLAQWFAWEPPLRAWAELMNMLEATQDARVLSSIGTYIAEGLIQNHARELEASMLEVIDWPPFREMSQSCIVELPSDFDRRLRVLFNEPVDD